jgi:hypothetical protein
MSAMLDSLLDGPWTFSVRHEEADLSKPHPMILRSISAYLFIPAAAGGAI